MAIPRPGPPPCGPAVPVDGKYWTDRFLKLQDPVVDPDKWPELLEATLSQLNGKQCNALL